MNSVWRCSAFSGATLFSRNRPVPARSLVSIWQTYRSQVLSGLRTRLVRITLTCSQSDRCFPSNVHINILRGLPCRLESLRLKFTNEPSIFVDGDLDESIKRSASDRLGDLVPQVRARTFPGVFRDMALLGLCLELSFNVLYCRTQANLPTLMHFAEPAIWPSSIRTEDPTCANHVDVLTVWSVCSFECPYQHPPWSPVSIGKPAPKIHQWTIYFCRWGFGWVDKAQCFRSARWFGAAGSSPDFSRGFSRHGAPRPLSWTFFQCTLLSYPGQPSYSQTYQCWRQQKACNGGGWEKRSQEKSENDDRKDWAAEPEKKTEGSSKLKLKGSVRT